MPEEGRCYRVPLRGFFVPSFTLLRVRGRPKEPKMGAKIWPGFGALAYDFIKAKAPKTDPFLSFLGAGF